MNRKLILELSKNKLKKLAEVFKKKKKLKTIR